MIKKRFSIGAKNPLLDAFESGANGMNHARSALLMLIAGILLGAPSRGSETARFRADRIASRWVDNQKSSTISPHSSVAAHRPTLSPFTPWKTRIKSVLGETYQRVSDESELGLAIPPGQLLASVTRELASRRLPIRPPLRC
jgi:hypothetical protein